MPVKTVAIISHYANSLVNFRGPMIRDILLRGHRVVVQAPDFNAATRAAMRVLGADAVDYPLARTGLNPLQDLRTLFCLWQEFRQSRPDVVFTYAAKTNVWGMLAARLAGVPRRVAMVEGMGYAFTEGVDGKRSIKQRLLGVVLATLYRLAFRCADVVLVLNRDDARDLERWCGLSPAKTVLLGGIGVALEDWPEQPPHKSPLTFTLIARMLREKGIFEFLHAAKRIKARHPQVRFRLLGGLDSNPGGVQASDLQPWVDAGVVEWPGQVDVKPWLEQTSVFVLPSYYREGVPRSTQEAMAMGRPVITTDVPGCRETVVNGVNGFLVPPRNVDALVQAMERFILNPGLIAQMGGESRRIAEQKFDVRKVNAVLLRELGLK